MLSLLLSNHLIAAEAATFFFESMDQAEGVRLVGAAKILGGVARLTPLQKRQSGALWKEEVVPVSPSFETEFSFRLTRARQRFVNGSDGFAFVIQNVGPAVMGGIGSSGGFGVTRGDNPPSDGIERSLAVFFDTHKNAGEGDPTDNSIGLYTNDDDYFPPRRLAIRNNAPVRLNDGRRHRVRIRYDRPFLEVWLDGIKVLVASVELDTVVGAKRMAFVGFTASTGEGYQCHDILAWRFTPSSASSQTHVNFEEPRQGEKVESQIRFGAPCIMGRTLCTPVDSEVRMLAPNRWSVILPVQLPWSTDIPNPSGKAVSIRNQAGTICWKSGALGETRCHGPEGDADGRGRIMFRHRNGKTSFSIDINGDVSTSEGYYSFEVAVPE